MQTSGSAAIKKLIQLVKSALSDKMDKAGGTFTGNVSGKYFTGTWLQTLEATDLGRRSSNPISAQAAAESMSVRCSTRCIRSAPST